MTQHTPSRNTVGVIKEGNQFWFTGDFIFLPAQIHHTCAGERSGGRSSATEAAAHNAVSDECC